jgi:hypothetical protein
MKEIDENKVAAKEKLKEPINLKSYLEGLQQKSKQDGQQISHMKQ